MGVHPYTWAEAATPQQSAYIKLVHKAGVRCIGHTGYESHVQHTGILPAPDAVHNGHISKCIEVKFTLHMIAKCSNLADGFELNLNQPGEG